MKKTLIGLSLLALLFPGASFAAEKTKELFELKSYPVNSLNEIISKIKQIQIDEQVSSDGKASLKIKATEPLVINLFKTGDIDIEDAKLIYKAKIKTENFKGQAYLEMWCGFDGKGRFFSRDLASPVKGNTKGWIQEETPFFLKKGENPNDVELNLVINGTGTVWIDDVKLVKAPLK
ncbi:MAG: hypothetical protein AB1782_00470 [Cyanobacteriota bacterium]